MTESKLPVIAVTGGDPSGIGPEIVARAAADPRVARSCRLLVVGDPGAIAAGIELAGVPLQLQECNALPEVIEPGVLYIRAVSRLEPGQRHPGEMSAAGGDAAYRAIRLAGEMCMSGEADGMATAPISKAALNRAGHHYPGHTELLAEMTGTRDFVMMLAGERLRVALVTIHEALADVPRLITYDKVLAAIRVTCRDTSRYFCREPRIAVLALNPHSGEQGLFGTEEIEIIGPAVEAARREGINAAGPLAADTLFHFAARGEYDAVVAMYHDQGLIPLKLLHFDDGVNITLGLPILRTSVDHGTAYDLAGKGHASAGSMIAAITMAAGMAVKRRERIGA